MPQRTERCALNPQGAEVSTYPLKREFTELKSSLANKTQQIVFSTRCSPLLLLYLEVNNLHFISSFSVQRMASVSSLPSHVSDKGLSNEEVMRLRKTTHNAPLFFFFKQIYPR